MNLLAQRRARPDPGQTRKAEEAARQQIALAVSLAKKKAKAETQAEVLDALQQVVNG